MNKSASIREWITAQGQPATVNQIADALKINRVMVSWMVGRMYRDGILARTGLLRDFRYTVVREVAPPLTPEQARLRRNERERIRQAARNVNRRSKAQYLADIAAAKEARLAARQAEVDARKALRERERLDVSLKRAQAAVKRLKKAKPEKVQPSVVKRLVPQTPAPKAVPAESVAEWMARTGKQPEVLPTWAASRPLKCAGHRSLNDATWRKREEAAA